MQRKKGQRIPHKLTFDALNYALPAISKLKTARLNTDGANSVRSPVELRHFFKIVNSDGYFKPDSVSAQRAERMVLDDPAKWLPLLVNHEPAWTFGRRKISELFFLLFLHAQHGKGFLAHESFKILSQLLPKRRVGGGSLHTQLATIFRAYQKRLREVNAIVTPQRREKIRRRYEELGVSFPLTKDRLERLQKIGQEFYDDFRVELRLGDIRAALAKSNESYVSKWVADDFGVTKNYVEKTVRKSFRR